MVYGNFREDIKQATEIMCDIGVGGIISQDRLELENVYI
tara:strand:- start:2074 stop:2190 length:117 start_codon:yes stop_codon:yes gene_type:complete